MGFMLCELMGILAGSSSTYDKNISVFPLNSIHGDGSKVFFGDAFLSWIAAILTKQAKCILSTLCSRAFQSTSVPMPTKDIQAGGRY